MLNIIHSLAENVIREKWRDIEKKTKRGTHDDEKSIEHEDIKNVNYTEMHYVRDDLDDIDENNIKEKKRLAFLEALMDMRKNNEQMTDEEIWEEVNTIMFEV